MAIAVKLESLSDELKRQIVNDLTVSSKVDYMGYAKGVNIYPYAVEDELTYLPFYYGTQLLKKYPNDATKYSPRAMKFAGQLRPYQVEVVRDAIARLNAVRCIFLAMATGKGKTPTSLYLATRLQLKTVVLIHRDEIFKGWMKSIPLMIPGAKFQRVNAKEPLDPDIDFYLINPLTLVKRSRADFTDIGLLIADEAHVMCSEKMSESLLYVTPKYCIGLSASPDRTDKLDKIIDLHFGVYHIEVPLWVEHSYYKFETGFVPEVKRNIRGDTDWNSVLAFQADHLDRNIMIMKLCMFFNERNILVLCKRQTQTKSLYQMLTDEKESVDYTTGTKKKYDPEARILVTTYSKSGVGFDHPKLDMLIVASDVEEQFDQYFGRCVRREDSSPIVVDLVDNLKSLERHYATRKSYAVSIGGKIKNFRTEFPLFFKEPEIVFA